MKSKRRNRSDCAIGRLLRQVRWDGILLTIMGSESFPLLLFFLEWIFGVIGVLGLAATVITAYFYYHTRQYPADVVRDYQKKFRKDMQFGLVTFIICGCVVAILWSTPALLELLSN